MKFHKVSTAIPDMRATGASLLLVYAGPILFQESDTTHNAPPMIAADGASISTGMRFSA